MDLQDQINTQIANGKIELSPGEFFGQLTIDRPLTLVGTGKATWIGSKAAPAIRITSAGVKLQNLMIELAEDAHGPAIQADPGCDPVLEDVIVRGVFPGVRDTRISTDDSPQLESSVQIVFSPPPPISPITPEDLEERPSDSMSGATRTLSHVEMKIDALFDKAAEAENRRDWETVIECYQDILTLRPGHTDAEDLLNLARKKHEKTRPISQPTRPAPPAASQKARETIRQQVPDRELINACRYGTAQEVANLLDQGANPDATVGLFFPGTALIYAARRGNEQVVEQLLSHGANPDLRDWRGITALSEAFRLGHTGIVALLLRHGAQIRTS